MQDRQDLMRGETINHAKVGVFRPSGVTPWDHKNIVTKMFLHVEVNLVWNIRGKGILPLPLYENLQDTYALIHDYE